MQIDSLTEPFFSHSKELIMSDILHRVGIDAQPDKVFDALTTIWQLRVDHRELTA